MDNFDKLHNIREQQFYEMPSSQENVDRVRTASRFPKIVAIILIVVLILTTIYAFLHPIHKIILKFFLFRNCTLEVVATAWMEHETRKVCIDGNLVTVGDDYYEIDGDIVYKYVKTGKYTWKCIPAEEEWANDYEVGNKLLDVNSYKRVKGKLFTWRLKNSVAETIDELSSIILQRDAGKIAIVGYYNGVRISVRFTLFGRTKIDPPWEEPGMILEQ